MERADEAQAGSLMRDGHKPHSESKTKTVDIRNVTYVT